MRLENEDVEGRWIRLEQTRLFSPQHTFIQEKLIHTPRRKADISGLSPSKLTRLGVSPSLSDWPLNSLTLFDGDPSGRGRESKLLLKLRAGCDRVDDDIRCSDGKADSLSDDVRSEAEFGR